MRYFELDLFYDYEIANKGFGVDILELLKLKKSLDWL